jgi:MFS family permease
VGTFTAVVGASVPAGPLLGGAIVDGASWRWIFWINLPIVAVVIPLTLTKVTPSRGPRAGLDIPGLLLATGAAFGLVWGRVRGSIGFLVEDLDAAATHLCAAGVEVGPVSEHERERYLHFRAPDGGLYELVERKGAAA